MVGRRWGGRPGIAVRPEPGAGCLCGYGGRRACEARRLRRRRSGPDCRRRHRRNTQRPWAGGACAVAARGPGQRRSGGSGRRRCGGSDQRRRGVGGTAGAARAAVGPGPSGAPHLERRRAGQIEVARVCHNLVVIALVVKRVAVRPIASAPGIVIRSAALARRDLVAQWLAAGGAPLGVEAAGRRVRARRPHPRGVPPGRCMLKAGWPSL